MSEAPHTIDARTTWTAVLAGPAIWFGHFMAVYLIAEAACAAGASGGELLGLPVLSLAILGATAVAVLSLVVVAAMTLSRWRREPADARELLLVGLALDALFILGILFVGLPALVLPPC